MTDSAQPAAAPTEDARLDFERAAREPTDLELEPVTAEDEDSQSAPPAYEISTYPSDFTLEVLHQQWKNGDIEIPEFQRRFVWKKVQASRLIESFMVRLPVPAIFLYTERHSEKYLVIDGQQRLRSVFHYFDGVFPSPTAGSHRSEAANGSVFRLTGLDRSSPFHNRGFDQLSEAEQRRLKNAVLRAFIVQQLDPDDHSSIYHIFERLNTGGTLLANQEIRNCVYRGGLVLLIEELNTFGPWRRILGKEPPDSRRRDMELITRFFATQDLSAYRTPMKRFLSRYMYKNRNAADEALAASGQMFRGTCQAIVEHLGERPFHIRRGLNIAALDSVMVAFSKNLDRIPNDIRHRYEVLKSNDAFLQTTTQRTTDAERVRQRFRLAFESLFDR